MTPLAAEARSTSEKPTVYRGAAALIGGAAVVLFCGLGSIDLLVESGTRDLVAAAVLMLVTVLAGLYGVYPVAFSWTDRLVVRNPFRTVVLPWDTVTDLSARLSFVAHTETRQFTVWAIPVSLRERRRAERHRIQELSYAQRMAKRGVSADMLQSRPRRPQDPAERLSFADQAIAEMNARREAHQVQARFKAKATQEAAAAEQTANEAGNGSAVGDPAPGAPATAPPAAAHSAVARWSWPSFLLVGASLIFLIVAIGVR
ncbi:PH domain-containing protein [Actinocrinis puniceicyclus]|uniref:PH domain-containing protein n=1 Tax=Actinocrinis puniceicyclus TaxID=977794 RepID=A0A8J7WKF9_9ACTN|nr:PH domain-containing protein [Actinocrinis puniceicyclus]MBS2961767.1 PH domain-containing protein [Actinocrinis puniceicyclus]